MARRGRVTDAVTVGVVDGALGRALELPRRPSNAESDDLSLTRFSNPVLATLRMAMDEIVSETVRDAPELRPINGGTGRSPGERSAVLDALEQVQAVVA